MIAVEFDKVDIVFGDQPRKAFAALDQQQDRETILAETGQVLGVADASLSVNSGEICVLMGLSGSGKSTLLRAVNGLNPVSRGQVKVAHEGGFVDMANCDGRTLRNLRRKRIAMVFQQFALLPWRTVRENVGFGLELQGMSKAELNRVVDDKLALVGLTQWADKYTHELSGGMQQRVGLARAFATDADILLMDEPFSALDPLIRDKLQDELLELQRELKKTIIFVSHDLDEAMKLGNRIAIMEGGRVVQYAPPEEIVLQPANDYVSEFVAHLNPMNVLRAGSLMRPLVVGDNLLEQGMVASLQSAENAKMLNREGQAVDITMHGLDNTYSAGSIVGASIDVTLRDALSIRQQTSAPILLHDHNGYWVGALTEKEIFSGLLRNAG
ncbi:MAG: choline ABC transporter ATP-binding protein [Gammaproteobacteria bacterium]|nr:choline ABC transporter ATP-binding protein [Gammaproteobacteria bacterium]